MSWLLSAVQSWFSRFSMWLWGFDDKKRLMVMVKGADKTVPLPLERSWDMSRVKEEVAPKLGLRPNDMALIFAGKRLSDSTLVEVRCYMF